MHGELSFSPPARVAISENALHRKQAVGRQRRMETRERMTGGREAGELEDTRFVAKGT